MVALKESLPLKSNCLLKFFPPPGGLTTVDCTTWLMGLMAWTDAAAAGAATKVVWSAPVTAPPPPPLSNRLAKSDLKRVGLRTVEVAEGGDRGDTWGEGGETIGLCCCDCCVNNLPICPLSKGR